MRGLLCVHTWQLWLHLRTVNGGEDLGDTIITNVGIESRHQHEGLIHQLADAFCVSFDTYYTILGEGTTTVTKQTNGTQHVGDDDRFEHVQLEAGLQPQVIDVPPNGHWNLQQKPLCGFL